jgi:hypothetical protein
MLAKRAKLSRITVAKYLTALSAEGAVEVTRIGKALAWHATERKPHVGIIAKTGTARIIQLALGKEYHYVLATNASQVKHCFLVLTDQPRIARSLGEQRDVILIGETDERAFSIPELFETGELVALVRKIEAEQEESNVPANACIAIENIEDCEELFGFQGAEELIELTMRLLEEHAIPFTQYQRTYFLLEERVSEEVLADIEQTFHTLLAHLYGEMVTPGEEMTYDDSTYLVPSLTITLSAPPVAVDPKTSATAN